MTELLMPRRKFLTGLFGLVAAPAVVKAANIMPVKVLKLPPPPTGFRRLTPDDYRKGGGIRLSELREILRPGLQKMVDDMYTEHLDQWESMFIKT
jgi:hypothetical protein